MKKAKFLVNVFLPFGHFTFKSNFRPAFLLGFLLFFQVCFPQGNFLRDTLKVTQIAQKQGLSQLNVLGIDFDENGYLWAGTEDGLNRFNGYEMKVFPQSKNSSDLIDDHIRGLVYTHDTLWLATNTRSVAAYVLSQNRFLDFMDRKSIQSNEFLRYGHGIFVLNERFLLAATLKNCLLINRKTLEMTVLPLPKQSLNDYVLSVFKMRKNKFLLGTFFNGIIALNLAKKNLTRQGIFHLLKTIRCTHFTPTEKTDGTSAPKKVCSITKKRPGKPPK